MAAGGAGWPLTSHLTSQSECHPLPDSHTPLYCGTLSSDRNLLGGGESEAPTEGQGDPETSFPSARDKAALMQTPGHSMGYVNGAPCIVQGIGCMPASCSPGEEAPEQLGSCLGVSRAARCLGRQLSF